MAASKAGLAAVPCLVREMTDAERIEVMLAENLQRSDGIPVLAEATGYFRLVGEHGYTIRRLARQVGRSERHVRSRLALLELPEPAQDALQREELTVGQAEALLAAKDRPQVVEAVLAEPEWRRRDMEQAVTNGLRRAEQEDQRAALLADLEAAGVRVVASEGHRPENYVRLSALGLNEADHQGETCHALVVETGYAGPSTEAVCTDRRRHNRRAPAGERSELVVEARPTDPERERAKERRRLAQRRSEFLASRLTGRLPKGPAVDMLTSALIDRANTNDANRAGTLLGVEARPGRYGGRRVGPGWDVAGARGQTMSAPAQARPAGAAWVGMLAGAVRVEFDVECYRPAVGDTALGPMPCRVAGCAGLAKARRLCHPPTATGRRKPNPSWTPSPPGRPHSAGAPDDPRMVSTCPDWSG